MIKISLFLFLFSLASIPALAQSKDALKDILNQIEQFRR